VSVVRLMELVGQAGHFSVAGAPESKPGRENTLGSSMQAGCFSTQGRRIIVRVSSNV
jgi:hypothetical protein